MTRENQPRSTPRIAVCANCGKRFTEEEDPERFELTRIPGLLDRISPGERVPLAECPDPACRALAYPPGPISADAFLAEILEGLPPGLTAPKVEIAMSCTCRQCGGQRRFNPHQSFWDGFWDYERDLVVGAPNPCSPYQLYWNQHIYPHLKQWVFEKKGWSYDAPDDFPEWMDKLREAFPDDAICLACGPDRREVLRLSRDGTLTPFSKGPTWRKPEC